MKSKKKVIWKEGMFVTPHHFQQWDRHVEHRINSMTGICRPFGWGVIDLQIDPDALDNGNVVVRRMKAVFPDGTLLDTPVHDTPPPSRSFFDFFSPQDKSLDLFLGIPLEMEGVGEYLLPDDGETVNTAARYTMTSAQVKDAVTGGGDSQILVAEKNTGVFFGGETLENLSLIKIGELVRTATGGYDLDGKFIPSLMTISGSGALLGLVRGLVEALCAKSLSLSEQRRQKNYGAVEFGISDITHFWLLNTINSVIPKLNHFFRHPSSVHPESLYILLATLEGQLLTFALEGHPGDIPPYSHKDPGPVFQGLDQRIRQLLEIVIPSKWVQIPLEEKNSTLWQGKIQDPVLFESASFFLAVHCSIPDDQVRTQVAETIKIGALNDIDTIINAALPGIGVLHNPRPPGSLPIKLGYHYFQLDTYSEFWQSVAKSGNIAIYVPSKFPELKLELIAIKQ